MKIDLQKPWEERTKYEKCAMYLMNDYTPLRSLRNRIIALKAVAEKVAPESTFTAKDLQVAPMALARMYYPVGTFYDQFTPIKLVGTEECFVNLYDNKYIKVTRNIYQLKWTNREVMDFVDALCEAYGIVLEK